MSAADETHKSLRYKLGELLRDTSDHMLLLTATPHKGDPQNFSLFLQLLDADAYADVRPSARPWSAAARPSTCAAQRRRWSTSRSAGARRPGSPRRSSPSASRTPWTFQIDGAGVRPLPGRHALREATEHEGRGAGRRPARPRRRLLDVPLPAAAGLEHLCHATLPREPGQAAGGGLKRAQELARLAPPELPDPEELEEMEESERERLEEQLEAVTLAGNAQQVREEIQELKALAAQARKVEDSGCEAKLSKLKELLEQEGFFRPSGEAPAHFHRVQGHARLPREATQVLGFPCRMDPRRHEAGITR
jgi:hypothetical protein